MPRPFGHFALVLHAHVPYVLGHGTWPHGSEMLYEAAGETYMALLRMLRGLVDAGRSPKVTIGITPVVQEQLADSRFKDWFPSYLRMKADLARDNQNEFRAQGRDHFVYLAERWEKHYHSLLQDFTERYERDLLKPFAALQDAGHIELITSAATHGYFPLLREDASIQAQVRQGIATYVKHFGRRPRGFWLPECGYRPRYHWQPPVAPIGDPPHPFLRKGVEEFLSENGIDYFFVDSHMLYWGGAPMPVEIDRRDSLGKQWGRIFHTREPRPYHGTKSCYRPYFVGSHFEDHPPVAAFVRDPETGLQVWSGEHGYPGDFWYLDFHKKHYPGGHRYWRVTDANHDLGSKQDYAPEMARRQLETHAGNFLWMVKEVLKHHPSPDGTPPILCAPFDAELFGHWWFEGIDWIGQLLDWLDQDPEIELTTCSEYLQKYEPAGAVSLPEGSWGLNGSHWVWLNDWTEWTWKRIYDAEEDMNALALEHGDTKDPALRAILDQAARELLLLQASDWQFLITTWSARDYAEARCQGHHTDFKRCADMARRYARGDWISNDEWSYLGHLQDRDRLFPDVEPRWFGVVEHFAR